MPEEPKKKRIISETSIYDPSTNITTTTTVFSDGSVKTTVGQSLAASKIDRKHERIQDEDEVNNE